MTHAGTIVAGAPVTRDAFFGGAVEVLQPASGHHRAGLEAVLLTAALPRGFAGLVVDLGAGAGVSGMCAAAAHAHCTAVLVERDPVLAACARSALASPVNRAFASRVVVAEVDIAASEAVRRAAGVPQSAADVVLLNPPFYAGGRVSAPRASARAAAHVLGDEGLHLWFRGAADCLKPDGIVIAIGRAADLAAILAAASEQFESIDVLPIHARPRAEAHRVLIRARAIADGETAMLPALSLHTDAAPFRPQIDRLMRGAATLGEIHAPWRAAERAHVDR